MTTLLLMAAYQEHATLARTASFAGALDFAAAVSDPGMGVVRHAHAGYDEAIDFARTSGVKLPVQS